MNQWFICTSSRLLGLPLPHTSVCPHAALQGNSEVGHNALGAGQLIDQGASLVDIALREGSIFSGEGWKYIEPSFASNTLHFIGLLSDGGVHSRTNQLHGCLRGAAERGAKKIRWAGSRGAGEAAVASGTASACLGGGR